MYEKLIGIILLTISFSALAEGQWYTGKINRIWPYDQEGDFIITFESSPNSLSDCKHGYAYFRPQEMQPVKLQNSMSIALSAFHSGALVGVIIDKGAADELCIVTGIDIRK